MMNSSNKKSKMNINIGNSAKKYSRYDFPDFTIDSPKTNVNTSSKIMMNGEQFDSDEREFKHV